MRWPVELLALVVAAVMFCVLWAWKWPKEHHRPEDHRRCWYCKGSGRAPEGGDCYMCDDGFLP